MNELSSLFSGKLLLKHEFQLEESQFQNLLQEKLIEQTPGIKYTLGFPTCQRCFNQDKKYFGKLPCNILYCRKCIMMGRVSEKEPLYYWTGPDLQLERIPNACSWEGELTPLQKKASQKLVETIESANKLLIHAVCGAGKTEMLYAGITHAAAQGKKVCIATPRTDVVRELAPRLRRDFPRIRSAALYGGSTERDHGAHLVISTTHQLLRYQKAFNVVIVDEVDAFPYHKDKSLPLAVKRAAKENHALIYLTATPRLNLKIQSKLKQIPTVSIPMRYHGHPLPVPTFKHIPKLEQQLANNQLPKPVQQWIDARKNRRFLMFAPTVELAKKLSNLTDAPYVFAESPDRKTLIQQFRNHQMSSLITTTILERGVTFPSIDVAVILADHHVFDEAALIQIAGRAGRSAQDPTGDVVFFYETKTNAMVQARQYTINKNKEAKKWLEVNV